MSLSAAFCKVCIPWHAQTLGKGTAKKGLEKYFPEIKIEQLWFPKIYCDLVFYTKIPNIGIWSLFSDNIFQIIWFSKPYCYLKIIYAHWFFKRKSNNREKYKEESEHNWNSHDIFPPYGGGFFQTSLSFSLYIQKYAYEFKYIKWYCTFCFRNGIVADGVDIFLWQMTWLLVVKHSGCG